MNEIQLFAGREIKHNRSLLQKTFLMSVSYLYHFNALRESKDI